VPLIQANDKKQNRNWSFVATSIKSFFAVKLRISLLFSIFIHSFLVLICRAPQEVVYDLTEVQLIESENHHEVRSHLAQPKFHKRAEAVVPSKREPVPAQIMSPAAAESSQTVSEEDSSAVSTSEVTQRPEIIKRVKIPYPVEALEARVEGAVKLMLLISKEGLVKSAEIVNGPGHGLNEAAIAGIKEFRFSPAQIGDKKVATRISFIYRFNLKGL
jgi:protein TonB